ncbi:hypothetical protein F2P81_018154 [Scophthalmus maximus]|uniref:Uncharacterized protein n=1 Tax=Scophthalmus maximus TaxID=52904 RepID=A0A6A4S917_SCOMX|nr:hypothetical protein F2P81_018154 [Scophthalmus maximus]
MSDMCLAPPLLPCALRSARSVAALRSSKRNSRGDRAQQRLPRCDFDDGAFGAVDERVCRGLLVKTSGAVELSGSLSLCQSDLFEKMKFLICAVAVALLAVRSAHGHYEGSSPPPLPLRSAERYLAPFPFDVSPCLVPFLKL